MLAQTLAKISLPPQSKILATLLANGSAVTYTFSVYFDCKTTDKTIERLLVNLKII